MANMVKFAEFYQVTAVKWSKLVLATPLVWGSNPAESFELYVL
jgi:hypothetical protein